MTLFEYLAAGYVLMLSLAVLRAISGVPHAVRPFRRYWIHVVWLLVALGWCLTAFWAFWPYRHVDWTLLRFLNLLAIPALLYVFISLLVPPDPTVVTSWRDYFVEVRIPLFVTGALFMVAVITSNQFTLGVSSLHLSQLGNYFNFGMFIAGLAFASPRVHAFLAVVFLTVLLPYFFILMAKPDSVFR